MNYTNQKEINGTEKDMEYANGTRRRKRKNSNTKRSHIKTEGAPRKVENSRQRDQNIKCGTSAEAEEIMKHWE